jgi:hypothetical protein
MRAASARTVAVACPLGAPRDIIVPTQVGLPPAHIASASARATQANERGGGRSQAMVESQVVFEAGEQLSSFPNVAVSRGQQLAWVHLRAAGLRLEGRVGRVVRPPGPRYSRLNLRLAIPSGVLGWRACPHPQPGTPPLPAAVRLRSSIPRHRSPPTRTAAERARAVQTHRPAEAVARTAPLHLAAEKRHLSTLAGALIELRAAVGAADNDNHGATPLH